MPLPHALAAMAPAGPGHVVHYGIVFAGLAGLALMLVPAYAERWRPSTTMPDQHELRVRELRRRIAAGTLGAPAVPALTVPAAPAVPRALALPVALVGSLATAGVHAAVGPRHLSVGLLVGGFFLATATAQLIWATLVWSSPTRTLLWAGAAGNTALLAVWALSRTAGLPGLGREPVGPWDLAAGVWEVAVAAACLVQLRTRRATSGRTWHPAATGWLAASTVVLGILSVSGAPA